MADDTNPTLAVETAVDASSKPREKKTRAPRKPKAVAEAVVDTSVSAPVKKTRAPRKQTAASNAPDPVAVVPTAKPKASATAKKPTASKAQLAKAAPQKVQTTPTEPDGFADLLKLEEENQKLRQALSEKLRAENADLRKKLGLV
jgi:putative transposase